MSLFRINSPTGQVHIIMASNKYEAINKATELDNYTYSNIHYFKINK